MFPADTSRWAKIEKVARWQTAIILRSSLTSRSHARRAAAKVQLVERFARALTVPICFLVMASSVLRTREHGGGTESREARKQRLYKSRREREFYSYFESVLAYASMEPKFCDLQDPAAAASHRAVPSSDTTLTAFAQLAV